MHLRIFGQHKMALMGKNVGWGRKEVTSGRVEGMRINYGQNMHEKFSRTNIGKYEKPNNLESCPTVHFLRLII